MRIRILQFVWISAATLIFVATSNAAEPVRNAKAVLKDCIDTQIDNPKSKNASSDSILAHCQKEYRQFVNGLRQNSDLPRSKASIYDDLIRDYIAARLSDPTQK